MRISVIPTMPDNFELILFGDDQEGNAAKSLGKYEGCIDYICASPDRFGIHMGDAFDAFWIDDKRYDEITTKSRPKEQMRQTVLQLAPLAKTGRLLSKLKGNHEKTLEMKLQRLGVESDVNEQICAELRQMSGTIYPINGTYSNKIEFLDAKQKLMFKAFLTHGRKKISSVSPDPHRKKANMQYRLKLILQEFAGDCILMVMAHIHLVLTTLPLPSVYLTSKGGKLKQHYTKAGGGPEEYIHPDHRFYGCSGSFLRTFVEDMETYSEMSQYNPTELGYLKAIVRDRTLVDLQEVKI